MSSEYPEPVKLYSFYNKKQDNGENLFKFDESIFPVYMSGSSKPATLPLNLAVGVEEKLKKPYSPKNLRHWDLMTHINDTIDMSLQQITDYSDVVCYHKFLRDLAIIPLGGRLWHNHVAFLYDGVVFIEEVTTSSDPVSSKDIEEKYVKEKFKKVCTMSNYKRPQEMGSLVDFSEGFYVTKTRVFKTGDSSLKVMFTGEVDAIYGSSQSDQNEFIDIKLYNGHRDHLFRGMIPYDIWAENYIIGNDYIAAGITKKGANSVLKKIETFHLSDFESKLPIPIPKIMEYVGKCLENIINACKKYPSSYIMIPNDDFSLRIVDEERMKLLHFSRPTPEFIKAFPIW
uniref:Decapping nuclease n=1 Tax=Strongyloides papillosus TaxID=174720 RepID=A0A0N5C2B7_STREA